MPAATCRSRSRIWSQAFFTAPPLRSEPELAAARAFVQAYNAIADQAKRLSYGTKPKPNDALGRLGAARGSLASTGGLAATVKAGYQARARWTEIREAEPVRISPDTPLAELRELGRYGVALRGWSE